MDFCLGVYCKTKCSHRRVDTHKFVKNIHNKQENEAYINLIKNVLWILQGTGNFPIQGIMRPVDPSSYVIINDNLVNKIKEDLVDRVLYLSQIYLWYLSLMAGGRILKKKFSQEYWVYFNYTGEDKKTLKEYINGEITLDNDKMRFTENVNLMYGIIEAHFDEFYNENSKVL